MELMKPRELLQRLQGSSTQPVYSHRHGVEGEGFSLVVSRRTWYTERKKCKPGTACSFTFFIFVTHFIGDSEWAI